MKKRKKNSHKNKGLNNLAGSTLSEENAVAKLGIAQELKISSASRVVVKLGTLHVFLLICVVDLQCAV